jgi:hypothetical protein
LQVRCCCSVTEILASAFGGTNLAAPHFSTEAATRRSSRRLSRIAKGRLRPAVRKQAHARIAKGGGLRASHGTLPMGIEPPQSVPSPSVAPSVAERAIDTATDVSRTIEEITEGLRIAVDRLRALIERTQRPGQPLAKLRAATREAPLTCLSIAFLLGMALSRRRR